MIFYTSVWLQLSSFLDFSDLRFHTGRLLFLFQSFNALLIFRFVLFSVFILHVIFNISFSVSEDENNAPLRWLTSWLIYRTWHLTSCDRHAAGVKLTQWPIDKHADTHTESGSGAAVVPEHGHGESLREHVHDERPQSVQAGQLVGQVHSASLLPELEEEDPCRKKEENKVWLFMSASHGSSDTFMKQTQTQQKQLFTSCCSSFCSEIVQAITFIYQQNPQIVLFIA